jgi:hypothetical protein
MQVNLSQQDGVKAWDMTITKQSELRNKSFKNAQPAVLAGQLTLIHTM